MVRCALLLCADEVASVFCKLFDHVQDISNSWDLTSLNIYIRIQGVAYDNNVKSLIDFVNKFSYQIMLLTTYESLNIKHLL